MSGAEPLHSLGLALVDYHEMDVCCAPTFNSQTMGQKRRRYRIFEGRLRSRRYGPLEIKKVGAKEIYFRDNAHNEYVDSAVGFIHQSVIEFSKSPGVWNLGCLHIEDQVFDPNAVLLCTSLHLVRLTRIPDDMERFFENLSLYCGVSDRSGSETLVPVLCKVPKLLECANSAYNATYSDQIMDYRYSHTGAKLSIILPLAVEVGMLNLVQTYKNTKTSPFARVIESFP